MGIIVPIQINTAARVVLACCCSYASVIFCFCTIFVLLKIIKEYFKINVNFIKVGFYGKHE